jgi:sulfide:quinone oxidoreductase
VKEPDPASKPCVLIAGGGVAAIELLLALRDLAGDRASVKVISPGREFAYRPLATAAAFGLGEPPRFDVAAIAGDLGAMHVADSVVAVQPDAHLAWMRSGASMPYDVLVLVTGAEQIEAVPGALTFRGAEDGHELLGVVEHVARANEETIAFAVPSGTTWPLPVYELALMTAARLHAANSSGRMKLVTPEESPLALFGRAASDAVRELLAVRAIELLASTHPVEFADGALSVVPEGTVPAEHVVALPRLRGRPLEGVPHDTDGFIEVDQFGRVRDVADVYAAGDLTAGSVKQGGIATQQADTVAAAIARQLGAPVEPQPFKPVLRGTLLTGDSARYMRNELTGGKGERSDVSAQLLWWPEGKVAGRHLSGYLAHDAQPLEPAPPLGADAVPVDVDLERMSRHGD